MSYTSPPPTLLNTGCDRQVLAWRCSSVYFGGRESIGESDTREAIFPNPPPFVIKLRFKKLSYCDFSALSIIPLPPRRHTALSLCFYQAVLGSSQGLGHHAHRQHSGL